MIPDGGAAGALAELERRKFTAEEGVSTNKLIEPLIRFLNFQDHLTLLNGLHYLISLLPINDPQCLAYNSFIRYGKSAKWCHSHALNFRALSRAVSIRAQLKRYMQRFNLPIESCEGDAKRLRKCLVSGLWKNSAKWVADGTYRSVRGSQVMSLLDYAFISICLTFIDRRCMCIRHLFCSLESLDLDGWSFTRWKKQKRLST